MGDPIYTCIMFPIVLDCQSYKDSASCTKEHGNMSVIDPHKNILWIKIFETKTSNINHHQNKKTPSR
jgi:hypothetical protein